MSTKAKCSMCCSKRIPDERRSVGNEFILRRILELENKKSWDWIYTTTIHTTPSDNVFIPAILSAGNTPLFLNPPEINTYINSEYFTLTDNSFLCTNDLPENSRLFLQLTIIYNNSSTTTDTSLVVQIYKNGSATDLIMNGASVGNENTTLSPVYFISNVKANDNIQIRLDSLDPDSIGSTITYLKLWVEY